MSPDQLAVLKTEVTTDPKVLGYAGKQPYQIMDLMNSLTGPGVAPVSVPFWPKPMFMSRLIPAMLAFSSLSAQLQGKWSVVLSQFSNLNDNATIDLTAPEMQVLLVSAVTDGLLMQNQVTNAINTKPGSRAEVLFGCWAQPNGADYNAAMAS